MTEKVIHEVRFIETDEGYRIEVNGDKEKLSRMGFDPEKWFRRGMGAGLGRRHGRHHRSHRHHPRHEHRHHKMHGRFGRGFMPPWMWSEWSDDVDETDAAEAPAPKA